MIRVAGDHGGGERGIGGREAADVLRNDRRGVVGQLFDLAVQQQRNEHILMKGHMGIQSHIQNAHKHTLTREKPKWMNT